MVKPCKKCGAMDRYKRGDCKLCQRLYERQYKADPEKRRIAYTKWARKNPEKLKIKRIEYKKSHPNAYTEWAKINKEKIRLYNAEYKKINADKVNIHCHNYRARKRDNGGKLSPDLAEILFKRQKGKCACCKEPLGKGYHLDHIMPLKLGGKNEDCNMQLLKASCNLQKHAKHPVEFMQNKGLLL